MSTEARNRLLSIGELSRLTGVNVSTIRNWGDKYGLLHPARSSGGFRMYTSDDVGRVAKLKTALLQQGIPPALANLGLLPMPDQQSAIPPRLVSEDTDSWRSTAVQAAVDTLGDSPSGEERLRGQIRLLHRAATELARHNEADFVSERVLSLACHLLDAVASGLLVFGEPDTTNTFGATKSVLGVLPPHITQLDVAITAELRKREGPWIVHDPRSWVGKGLSAETAHGMLIAIPLTYSEKLLGAVYVAGTTRECCLPGEMSVAMTLGNIAACVLETAEMTRRTAEANRRYEALLEGDDSLMLLADSAGSIAYASHNNRRVLGYEPADLLGKPLKDLLVRKGRRGGWHQLERTEAGVGKVLEVELRAEDGGVVAAEIRLIRQPRPGGTIRYEVRDLSDKRRLELELAARERQIRVIDTIAAAISESLDLDEVLQLAVDTVVRVTEKENTIISLLDEQSGELVMKAHCNAAEDVIDAYRHIKLGEAISGRVAMTGDPILSPDIGNDPRTVLHRHKGHAFLGVPLKANTKVVGTLMITSRRFQPITEEEMRLFVAIGRLIGRAVERAKMHEQSVKSYYDRLVMMRDELRLAAFTRAQERLRIASEIRRYVLEPLGGLSRGHEMTGALAALRSLEGELGMSMEGITLPMLLEDAMRWRRAYDPNGWILRVECDAWPDDVPYEVSFQLYTLAVRLLAKTRRVEFRLVFETLLVHDSASVGMQLRRRPVESPLDAATSAQLDWRDEDILDAQLLINPLGGKVRIETDEVAATVVATVPRTWDQVERRKPITAIVVNDQPLYGQALASLLDSQDSVQVVGVAQSPQEALELIRRLSPDVAVVDVGLPAMKGIDVTRAIRGAFPEARILILTPDQGQSVVEGLLAGATGFVHKWSSPLELLRAMNSLLRSEPALTPDAAERALALLAPVDRRGNQRGSAHRLTPRETEVLRLIAAGKSSKESCRILRITDKTFRRHISNMYQKLQIFDRAQLVLYAARKGMIAIADSRASDNPQLYPNSQ